MHIVIPIHDFNAGGTEIMAFRLAEAWLRAGCRVSLLAGASEGSMRERVPLGVEVQILSPEVLRSRLSRLRLGPAMEGRLKALAPDLVFLTGNFHLILGHAVRKAIPGTPVVAKISNPLVPGSAAWGPLANAGGQLLRALVAPIDMAVAMSHGLAAEYRRLIPGAAVCTIFDPNIGDDVSPRAMRDLRGVTRPLKLCAIGRLEPQKNFALAIETLARLRMLREAQLTILGEGKERAKLARLVRRRGLGSCVHMLGFVGDVAQALDEADILLVSSRYEGGPATAIEALAAGVPVVSTDCSHLLREVLTSERLGRLACEPTARSLAEAVLAQLETKPASREELISAIDASRYSSSANDYLKMFERLIGDWKLQSRRAA